MLEIRTLGGLAIRANGQAVEGLGSHKAEAMLVYLAVEGRSQNRNILAALLWPESSEKHALTSLRVALSVLRKKLGGYLDIIRDSVGLKPDARYYLDIADLEDKLVNGQIETALQIYRGEFLQGFHVRDSSSFEDWLRLEQERLRNLMISALHTTIAEVIDTGDYSKGLTFAQRLLELDPLDELTHQQYIHLLVLNGQRTTALAHYEKCKAILEVELGVEPSQDIQDLYKQIQNGEEVASLELPIPNHNLPASQTSFVGRDKELVQIKKVIHDPDCRLLTLVGPGGSGKTRLALQAAAHTLQAFQDGTYFIPLDTSFSADYLIPDIAAPLEFNIDNFVNQQDPKTQLLDYLRNRSILLVMDGFENVISAAGLISELLKCAPNVKVLATSRQRLDLKGEWIFHTVGLPVPQKTGDTSLDDSSSVRLFVDRANQTKMETCFSSVDYEQITRICQLVEGMPLGIELAAAWTSVLSPKEITEEMESSLDFLSTSTSDISEKHRSLRAVFDSSWMMLTDAEKEALSKLSVFRSGFDRQAAERIADADLTKLSSLLDKSLLKRSEIGYFSMHRLIQQFSTEKLSQIEDIQEEVFDRYCHYYTEMLAQQEAELLSTKMLQARDEIRKEMENMRAAVFWACLHWETGAIRKMLNTLLAFYIIQGWHEGIDAFRNIARRREELLISRNVPDLSNDAVILSARIHQAFLLSNLGQIEESETISRECMEGLSNQGLRGELSECLQNLGVNACYRGDSESAKDYLEEAILLGREIDNILWPTYLLWLGYVYFLLGEYDVGMQSLQKSHDIFNSRGNLWGTGFALSKMGLAADGLGDHLHAIKYHSEACEIFERISNPAGKGYSLSRMSMSAYFLKDYPQAVIFGKQGYLIFQEIGHRWGLCASTCRLGFAYIGLDNIEKAKGSFKNALHHSRRNKMIPLSLYAMAGLACILALEGEERKARELYHYVKHHPKTPTPYLEQATHWMGKLDNGISQESCLSMSKGKELETIDEVVARLLE